VPSQGAIKDGDTDAQAALMEVFGKRVRPLRMLCFIHKVRNLYKYLSNLTKTAATRVKELRAKPQSTKVKTELAIWTAKCTCNPKCNRINVDTVKRFQKALMTAFTSAAPAYLPGQYPIPNPEWQGITACRSEVTTAIDASIAHLFDKDHRGCKHDSKWTPRTGHCVTCPAQQAQIRALIDEKIFGHMDALLLPGVGVVHTNTSERAGSIVLHFRNKSKFYSADAEVLKTTFGLCYLQQLAIYRQEINFARYMSEGHATGTSEGEDNVNKEVQATEAPPSVNHEGGNAVLDRGSEAPALGSTTEGDGVSIMAHAVDGGVNVVVDVTEPPSAVEGEGAVSNIAFSHRGRRSVWSGSCSGCGGW
jgi:hypothetical protein